MPPVGQEVINSLLYSYTEQARIQLEHLKEDLLIEEQEFKTPRRFLGYRIFKSNLYQEISFDKQQNLERKLCNTLKFIAEHINNNLVAASDNTTESRPFPAVNRNRQSNFDYDKFGVIHLKPHNEIKFHALNLRKQAIILHIIAKVLKLIESGSYMTKRELYYLSLHFCRVGDPRRQSESQTNQTSNLRNSQATSTQRTSQSNNTQGFSQANSTQRASQNPGSQSRNANVVRYNTRRLDEALDDLCCLAGCSKVHLHLLTQAKSLLYGDLKFELKNGQTFDCLSKKDGILLPTPSSPVTRLRSDAKFILVLEKDSVLQKILSLEDEFKFVENYKVILFTSKGYPDVAGRAFLNYLWSQLKIPILALTDADPHGMEIACSYKFGCYKTAYETNLAVPQIRWLGFLPCDMEQLRGDESKTLPLSTSDYSKLASLLTRPYLRRKPEWIHQLNLMRDLGVKAELEALEGEYLVKNYLPNKLRFASWL